MNTIEELKEFRAELVEARFNDVMQLTGYQDEKLARVANLHTCIAAIDAVIEGMGGQGDIGEFLSNPVTTK